MLNHWVVGSEGKEMGAFTDGEKLEGHTLRAGGMLRRSILDILILRSFMSRVTYHPRFP